MRKTPLTRILTAVVLSCALAVPAVTSAGCSRVIGIVRTVRTASPVQVTVLATTAVDAAFQLGEIVEQLRSASHKLALAKVIPLESDDVVQKAAIAFANAKDAGVAAMGKAHNTLQIAAAAAPMIGEAAKIRSVLSGVSGIRSLTGTAGLLSGQLPSLLSKASAFMKTLGEK